MIRRPPRSTQSRSSAASDVYKRQEEETLSALFVLKKVGRFSHPEMLGILDLRDIYEQTLVFIRTETFEESLINRRVFPRLQLQVLSLLVVDPVLSPRARSLAPYLFTRLKNSLLVLPGGFLLFPLGVIFSPPFQNDTHRRTFFTQRHHGFRLILSPLFSL